jgi:hypothetical protein
VSSAGPSGKIRAFDDLDRETAVNPGVYLRDEDFLVMPG